MRVEGDNIVVPEFNMLAMAYGLGDGLLEYQFDSPTLRRLVLPDMTPVDGATEPAVSPGDRLQVMIDSPFPLKVDEQLSTSVLNGGTARAFVLAWLANAKLVEKLGEMFTIKATNTTTLVANTWTNGALAFTQSLPAGRYAIVGARGVSAGLVAFRFVTPGSAWRPGALGYDAKSDQGDRIFRHGRLGVWDEFEHNTPPTVDFLSVSADTSQIVHLDLIKVR